MRLDDLPGGIMVKRGIDDLAAGRHTVEGLLVAMGRTRLGSAGIEVPKVERPEHRLYELLASEDPDSAHSRYNALLRRLVSFERTLECANRPTLHE